MDNAARNLRIPFLHANGPRSTPRMMRENADTLPVMIEAPASNCIPSLSLFGNSNEISIQHCGNDYRLRITRQDKLILTK